MLLLLFSVQSDLQEMLHAQNSGCELQSAQETHLGFYSHSPYGGPSSGQSNTWYKQRTPKQAVTTKAGVDGEPACKMLRVIPTFCPTEVCVSREESQDRISAQGRKMLFAL